MRARFSQLDRLTGGTIHERPYYAPYRRKDGVQPVDVLLRDAHFEPLEDEEGERW